MAEAEGRMEGLGVVGGDSGSLILSCDEDFPREDLMERVFSMTLTAGDWGVVCCMTDSISSIISVGDM